MAKQKVDRVKFNPPLGRMPVLQVLPPGELEIDGSYQRSIEATDSQALIKRIAQHWNWDLCQPLVVSRRRGEVGEPDRFFVIDGQHRLAGARMRGDIGQLPCVVLEFAKSADEAASFVHLNQARRPLNKLQLFKAAVASGDAQAVAIVEAMTDAGLTVAAQTNINFWKPGMVSNVGGIERAWERQGEKVTRYALRALAEAFSGQILQYAGTIFPGIVAVCSDETLRCKVGPGKFIFEEDRFERFVTMLTLRSQADWRGDIMRLNADQPDQRVLDAASAVLRERWSMSMPGAASPAAPVARVATPSIKPVSAPTPKITVAQDPNAPFVGVKWCDQCDMNITHAQLKTCKSRWCSLRKLG